MAERSKPATPEDEAAVDGIFAAELSPISSKSLRRGTSPPRVDESFIRDILQPSMASAIYDKENMPVGSDKDAHGLDAIMEGVLE